MAITTSQITMTTMEGWYSGATPPLNPLIGDLWLDTTVNEIKKWDGTNWVKQADTQGPQGPKGDSIKSREAYWIKSSTKPEESDKPDPETGDMKGWIKGSEPPESALAGILPSDKFWRIYKETYSNGESEYSKYSEVELIGSYEVLNGLVQFRNGVTTTENIGGQDVTVIDGGKIKSGSINAKKIYVEDLETLNATIGGFHIGKNSIYSGDKKTIDSIEKGIYFDSNGQSYFGDDKNFIRFYRSNNDNYKLQISADSLTFGSGISVEKAFEDIKGDIQNAQGAATEAAKTAEAAQGDIGEQRKYFYHDAIGAHVLDAVNGNFRTDIKTTGMYVVDTATETPITEITYDSLIFGVGNVCNGSNSIALGRENESETGCQFSYLEGNRCKIGNYGANTSISSHAEGHSTIYGARFSHTEGEATITATDEKPLVMYSHAEGTAQIKGASWCHAEGDSIATGDVYHGHLEGESKITDSLSSHSEGRSILVNCDRSHAEGMAKIEYGSIDHAEGKAIITRTKAADVEVPSHAEGTSKIEESWISHSEGSSTITGAKYAHAEGDSKVTGAMYAHAEGNVTEATGEASHAEGTSTIASGENSHASGKGTEAVGACQTVLGKYNTADAEKALIVGNGDILNKSNALTLDWDGNLKVAGDVTCDAAVGTASLSALNDTVAALSMVIDKIWTKIYPVGSIYISTSAESPADLFGGTWERIKDRFLLSAGDTYAAGNTGGSAKATLPSHTHTLGSGDYQLWGAKIGTGSTEPGNQISGDAKYYAAVKGKSTSNYKWLESVDSKGVSDVSQANMPPYLAVYVWKRIS